MSRSGADLALLLLRGFRALADQVTWELARRGFEDVRPVHEFALRAIAAGASTASELGRRTTVTKQAAAKTIAVLEKCGYIDRKCESGVRRKRLSVTPRGFDMMRQGESIFDDLRAQWEAEVGPAELAKLEDILINLVGTTPIQMEDGGL